MADGLMLLLWEFQSLSCSGLVGNWIWMRSGNRWSKDPGEERYSSNFVLEKAELFLSVRFICIDLEAPVHGIMQDLEVLQKSTALSAWTCYWYTFLLQFGALCAKRSFSPLEDAVEQPGNIQIHSIGAGTIFYFPVASCLADSEIIQR